MAMRVRNATNTGERLTRQRSGQFHSQNPLYRAGCRRPGREAMGRAQTPIGAIGGPFGAVMGGLARRMMPRLQIRQRVHTLSLVWADTIRGT